MKLEHVESPSPAFERKQRRHRQAGREAHQSKREKDGKKPFYLTLDREGIPYGLGKPAWVSEINKLARGLDPSCTHVRKQTYEDVIVFKERLNQKFEYFGELNEAHLRMLMGRAVDRVRTEIMAVIKNGGRQPNHIDSVVWERLLKLQASEQWQNMSNQGKKANAARKIVNRTGNRGVNGVRESLRERFGRSPDPDEVYAEATRHKGSRGRKPNKEPPTLMLEEGVEEESSENNDKEQSTEKSSGQRCNDEEVGHLSHMTSAHQVITLPSYYIM